MKTMKKMMVLVLSVLMVLGSTMVTSFAAKNDKITVTGTKVGETYSLYKMFDLAVNDEENPTAYTYKVNSGWSAFFTGTGAGAQYVTINAAGAVTEISDAKALAKAAAAWANKPDATASKEATGTTVEFTGLADGYWLITSTLGTFAMAETTPDASAVEINEKNPEDTIEKKVKEGGSFGSSSDAQIGDKVEFQSTVKLVPGTRNVKVHDTMDSGLTFNNDLVVTGLTEGTDYTVSTSGSDTFTITFTDTYINGLTEQKEVVITYSAKLNKAAVSNTPAIVEQKNTTSVTYGDKQSVESVTTTTTHKFAVHKYATDVDPLPGAEFSLKRGGTVVPLIKINDTNYRVAEANETGAVDKFATVAAGNIVIWGVDAETYTLEEVQEPSGYNRLTADVSAAVKADDSLVVDVENKAGTELPSTGGMGTTILYIIGGVLVVVCGVMLVAKKRTSNK